MKAQQKSIRNNQPLGCILLCEFSKNAHCKCKVCDSGLLPKFNTRRLIRSVEIYYKPKNESEPHLSHPLVSDGLSERRVQKLKYIETKSLSILTHIRRGERENVWGDVCKCNFPTALLGSWRLEIRWVHSWAVATQRSMGCHSSHWRLNGPSEKRGARPDKLPGNNL